MRARSLALGALAVAVAAVALLFASDGRTQAGGTPVPLPALGPADAEMTLIGAAPDGAPGEAWGYRELPLDVPPPVVDGARLEFGPLPEGRDVRQLAFLRHTDATGWQIADVPLDADGRPYRGPAVNALSPSLTPRGGGLVVGRDTLREAARQLVVLVRDRGGRWRERRPPEERLPAPDPDAEPPEEPAETDAVLEDGEELATDRGAGRVAAAAFDAGDRTGAYFGAVGQEVEDAIVRFDGETWTREPILVPAGTASARIVAVDAASDAVAFALLETADDEGRGIELYQRLPTGQWQERPLTGSPFADRADAARGIDRVGPLDGAADPLTVTTSGVWIDGSLRVTPAEGEPGVFPFTAHVDPQADPDPRVTGSWCDAVDAAGERVCARDLGFAFDVDAGYRSFAFAGDGFGERVITNPLDPGGDASTNRGTYARLAGETFERRRGGTGNGRRTGAFLSPDRGFLEGPVEIAPGARAPDRVRRWPVALRSVLAAATPEPGKRPGALDAGALAVGADGAVARFRPGDGWVREFLLTANGSVARPRLRGVAWPEPARAHAVGDLGALWMWRADTGLWERDPATPIGFEAQLLDVAFQPGAPERGYAVGRAGTALRYDKTWTQEPLPAGFETTDLTSVGFAGAQALATAGSDLLVNDGAGWRVDDGFRALLDQIRRGRPVVRVVRGLPDGGAVAAGRGFVAERDGPGQPWRFTDQPLPGQTAVAVAPFREGGRVRALVAVQPRLDYPVLDDPQQIDPDVPPPILPAQPLPGDGYLLRETASGWRDERRTAFQATSIDRPIKSDPVEALVVDEAGAGWAIGGWSGEPDFAGRGTKVAADRARVQTAAVFRYQAEGEPPGPSGRTGSPVPLPAGPLRLVVGGHAQCEDPCADLADQGIAPDRQLRAAIDQAATLAAQPNGPKAFLNTGGRLAPKGDRGLSAAEASRYAQLLAAPANLPVYSAASASDTAGGDASAFTGALAGSAAPFGTGSLPAGVSTNGIPGIGASGGARTHYAFDLAQDGRTLRVVFIDNSRGSLAASDAHQNPAEPQLPWLTSVLADAKARGIASIVVGSRDLSRFAPRLNAASDGDALAQVLVDNGASAYFFERPEENRALRIPSGGADQIPAFGTGTLGYRSPFTDAAGQDIALTAFGDKATLLAEIDLAARDAGTGRAPVRVRGLPVIEDLSLQAVDGTLLRRSRPALFEGLGRRPESGDRWGEPAGAGGPSPPGGDPYTRFPADVCVAAGCATRVEPEAEFTSSAPDIGDFVQRDPNSTNLRKPFIDPATDKVVTDSRSSLFCPFNAGETTVTIRSGGIAFSQKVTVLAGSAQRPCGTRPLDAARFVQEAPAAPAIAAPELPALAPIAPVVPDLEVPEPPAPPEPQAPEARPERPDPPDRPDAPPPPQPAAALPVVPLSIAGAPPAAPPPPTAGVARPTPPGGVTARVFEEKREEEAAPEQSQAFSRYDARDSVPTGPLTIGAVLLLAIAGAQIRNGPRRRDRRGAALAVVRTDPVPPRPRNRR